MGATDRSAACSGVVQSALDHLACSRCGQRYDADRPQGLCGCGGPLLARYDLATVRAGTDPARIAVRPPDLWRYAELLPVRSAAYRTSLGEGMTPLLPMPRLGAAYGVPRLLVKDEGALPTGSFKARGAAVGVSRARELGVSAIALPTNGNAGGAWAAYAARAGIAATVVMPVDAPAVTRAECALAGADLYLVRGLIGDAGRLVAAAAARAGWFEVATLKEPYRVEGKKTIGLELVEQLGWRMPDVVVYPTGGGVGLIGIAKALGELRELGWVDGPQPRFVAVQADGCAPIVAALHAGADDVQPWPHPHTVAYGINVAAPLGGRLVLAALRQSGGTAIAVSDAGALAAQADCAREEGLLVCPEGGAALEAVRRLRADGWIGPAEEVVVLNTGTALTYPELVTVDPPVLDAGDELPLAGRRPRP
jgi:threonine synthase